MHKYPAGTAVTVALPLVDLNGDTITPTGLSARVLDQDGVQLVAPYAPSNTDGDAEIEITVPASANQVASGLAGRTVELTITTANGTYNQSNSYLIEAMIAFTVPNNSFQSYVQALITAEMLPNLMEWGMANDEDRQRAMLEAYARLTRIGYRIRSNQELAQDRIADVLDGEERVAPGWWPQMTVSEWNALSSRFRKAMCRAQIIEANEVLRGVRPDDKRRMGILSESIGESSMMFRVGKPLDLGISQAALRELTGFLDLRATVGRT